MVRRTDMMNTTMMNHTKNTPKVVLKTDMNYDEHYSCTQKNNKKNNWSGGLQNKHDEYYTLSTLH